MGTGSQLMTLADVLNALQLAGVLTVFLVPTFITILSIHTISVMKERRRTSRAAKRLQEMIEEREKEQTRARTSAEENEEGDIRVASDGSEVKKNTHRTMCESLALEFDEKGKIKA